MKKASGCNYCKLFAGIIGFICFGFLVTFGAKMMLRSGKSKEEQYKDMSTALKESLKSPAVEAKLKDLVVTIIKEANFSDAQKASLKSVVRWNKVSGEEPCIVGMVEACSKRDVDVLAKVFGVDAAVISKFDQEEQALGEKLAKGDIDEASFKLMIEEMESKPEYAPIVEFRTSKLENEKFMEQFNKEILGDKEFTKTMSAKILEFLLDSFK